MASRSSCFVAIGLAVGSLLPAAVRAQVVPRLTVDSTHISADTVGLGDAVDLRLWISMAPGSVLFLPDSLHAPGFEPLGPMRWSADRERSTVEVTYPLIAFQIGDLVVPEFEVYGAAREEGVAAGMASTGDLVGNFDSFVDGAEHVPSARLRTVPPHGLWVGSVLIVEDASGGLRPRPPADVAGGSVSLLPLLLGLASAAALAWALIVGIGAWRRERAATLAAVSARDAALAALAELRDSGAHREGRTHDFFTRSSEVVRRYVETLRAIWGPAWTSTELMEELRSTPDGTRSDELTREMAGAEAVKFGGRRPDPEEAESHLDVLYEWVEKRPAEPATIDVTEDGS